MIAILYTYAQRKRYGRKRKYCDKEICWWNMVAERQNDVSLDTTNGRLGRGECRGATNFPM
jgi:hypothetical protein